MKKSANDQAALDYHSEGRAGKIEITATKPTNTARDLSLAYTPGVAAPCLEIAEDEEKAYKYTAKGNLVAVISNGSAVLGLGNIGPAAGKPVMEGKGVLFKRFADVDVFDIEIDETDVEGMVRVISSLEPTFGGINLEDIKAPECFEVEKALIERMNIPVFHDDQHGTAIIATAGFINAVKVAKKKMSTIKVVFNGAGAASIACAKLFIKIGVKKENLIMCDSKGVIYKGRTNGMNKYKEEFAVDTKHRTLEDAMKKADAFIGCSARGTLTKEMVKSMAKNPIIFAMANPEPEIYPDEAHAIRKDVIMATGRSDFPNQVNNVLGFPFIFRGALDVRAKKINEEMKIAAVYALADLAKEEVPEEVKRAYGNTDFTFGREYLIPKPFDKRVLTRVSPAVAKAAIESGVARKEIKDFREYTLQLEERLGNSASFMNSIRERISKSEDKVRMVFAEGAEERILRAVKIICEDDNIEPVLIGDKTKVKNKIDTLNMPSLHELEVIDPETDERFEDFVDVYYELRQRKGVTKLQAKDMMLLENYFASMLVREGHVDTMITGASNTYPVCVRPIMQIIGTESHLCNGIIILLFKNKVLFLADCTMNIEPNADTLSEIALSTSEYYKKIMLKKPRVGFLSFSNFGSNKHAKAKTVAQAVQLTKEKDPYLICDGEFHADVAVNKDLLNKLFPFSDLDQSADILIFPDLGAANIAYKLLAQLGDAQPIGPILVPLNQPANIVQRTSSVSEIVNMATVTALMSQIKKEGT